MSLPRWLQRLHDLCTLDSRTAANPAGVTQVAQRMGDWLTALGFELHWHDAPAGEGPRGRHLVALRPGRGPRLLLLGHSDTVLGPADVPFRHDPAQGKFYGAGVCDMKGGNVLLIEALEQAIQQHAAARQTELAVLFNASEEIAGPSFRALVRQWASGARACLTFEPARLGPHGEQLLVISRKSSVRCRVTCRGRAAHAGNEHASGINALRQIARIVEQLEALTDYGRDVTVNVGVVHGGLAANQVPDEAYAVFGLRTFEPQALDEVMAHVRAICTTPTVFSPRDGAPAQLEFDPYVSYPCWPQSPATLALATRYKTLAKRHGFVADTLCCGGAADSNHVADLCPVLDGMGIVGDGLHTHHEWADASSFEPRTRAAADIIGDLCDPVGDIATPAS